MAIANYGCFDVVAENSDGSIIGHWSMTLDFDDVSLVIQDVNLLNTTGQAHVLTLSTPDGARTASRSVPDGTNLQVSVASRNILMISTPRGPRPPIVAS